MIFNKLYKIIIVTQNMQLFPKFKIYLYVHYSSNIIFVMHVFNNGMFIKALSRFGRLQQLYI